MKAKILALNTIILLGIFFVSCSSEDDGIYFNDKNEDVIISYSNIEFSILELINEHRESKGLNKLNTFNKVSNEAKPHTNYMMSKGEASHDNFNIRSANLISNAGAKQVSENVAYGYSTAESVVKAWLRSDPHRAVIENIELTDFGISAEENEEGRLYFTNIFIRR